MNSPLRLRPLFYLAIFFIVATTPLATRSQENESIAPKLGVQEDKTSVAGLDWLPVIFTVTDKHGRFIRDLKQEQFRVLDNNNPPREVVTFEAHTDLPLRVGLLIDASNSIHERFLFEQQAATEFLRQIIRPQADQILIVSFDEVPDLVQDFTDDIDKLAASIKNVHPGGGRAMWDAVFFACRDKLMKQKSTRPVRRVVVLLSDGEDNQSRALREEAVEMALRADVVIYTISTNLGNNVTGKGDENLNMLAKATGGRAFFPFKLGDISDDFIEIQGELRSQYYLAYRPPVDFKPNGQFRPIQIIPDNPTLRIRVRRGYYAPKE